MNSECRKYVFPTEIPIGPEVEVLKFSCRNSGQKSSHGINLEFLSEKQPALNDLLLKMC